MSSVALPSHVTELRAGGCMWPGASDVDLNKVLSAVAVSVVAQRSVRSVSDEPLHIDDTHLTLAYVADGELWAIARDGGRCALPDGGVALLSPGSGRRLRAGPGSHIAVTELRLIGEGLHLVDLLPDMAWVCGFDALEPVAAALMQHLDRAAATSDSSRNGDLAIQQMLATALLQSTIRAWALACAPAGWPARNDDPFLAQAIEAIHAEPERAWTVDQLAAISAMSRSHFAERFRASVNCSPAGYVTVVRMRAARDLLARGERVVSVAHALGYASEEGFRKAFRRHHGRTPSQWRTDHAPEAVTSR